MSSIYFIVNNFKSLFSIDLYQKYMDYRLNNCQSITYICYYSKYNNSFTSHYIQGNSSNLHIIDAVLNFISDESCTNEGLFMMSNTGKISDAIMNGNFIITPKNNVTYGDFYIVHDKTINSDDKQIIVKRYVKIYHPFSQEEIRNFITRCLKKYCKIIILNKTNNSIL